MKKLLLLTPLLLMGCGGGYGFGYNGGGISLPSNFDWTPPTEDQLWNCTVTESAGTSQHWCDNGYPDLCDC